MGRALARVLRGHALQRLPGGLGHQLRGVPPGIEKVAGKGITSRGVLLDVVAHRGVDTFCAPGAPITPAELDEIAARQNVEIRSGDIVVVHTGWWTRFLTTGDGSEPGSGLHWTCARWLHQHEVAAVAADNLMVEDPDPSHGIEAPSCRCTCCVCGTWA